MIDQENYTSKMGAWLEAHGVTGLLSLIILALILVVFFKPENINIWVGYLLSIIGKPFHFLRKASIKKSLEGSCSVALKKISSELPEIDIPNLSIKWVSKENMKTTLIEGKAIVKLKFSSDDSRNVLKATSIYVRDAFLIHAKPYLHDDLKSALDFSITKKILINIRKNQKNLVSKFIQENIQNSVSISEKCDTIEEIDEAGLFTRILLRELDDFGTKLYGRNIKIEHKDEANNLLTFIFDISTREPDDNTPLAFHGVIIKVGVLLVAKVETYQKYGLAPYLRRIKLGLARNIDSFYLLAREDKVEILDVVAKELLGTGNFILINNPHEFRDSRNRRILCYVLKVNKDSIIADSFKKINEAINQKAPLEGVITSVRKEFLKVDFEGVEGIIKNHNISILPIDDVRQVFKENSYIQLLPLEIQKDGLVEFTLIGTNSDPNNYIKSNFHIGNIIDGEIAYVDDDFIKVNIGDGPVKGIAFRKNLTFSRFIFLHEKFKIGDSFKFVVLGCEFERANVRLKLLDLTDPWENQHFRKNQFANLLICKINPNSFVGEVDEGITGVLPFCELGWSESEIEKGKLNIKLNSIIKCKIFDIDDKYRNLLLTLKNEETNPYKVFLDNYKGEKLKFIVKEISAYGLFGIIDRKYNVYIPNYELSWNGSIKPYKIGHSYDVVLKGIDKMKNKFIGTFKPFIAHPLDFFCQSFSEGKTLSFLQLKECYEWGAILIIKHKNKEYEGVLFKGEISESTYIQNCKGLFSKKTSFPLIIKKIDKEKNKIILSLKELTNQNKSRITNLDYTKTYSGIILGKGKNYSVLIENLWIEGELESEKVYKCGDLIEVRPSLIRDNEVILTDD